MAYEENNLNQDDSLGFFSLEDLEQLSSISKPESVVEATKDKVTKSETGVTKDTYVNSPIPTTSMVGFEFPDESVNEDSEDSEESEDINQPDSTEDDSEDSDEFTFEPLINDLFDNNVIPEVDTSDITNDIEGFKKVIDRGVELKLAKALEERESVLSEETKKRIAIELAGGSLEELYGDQVIDYNEIDLDDEDNQRQLVVEYLTDLGYNDTQIEATVLAFESSATLDTTAALAQTHLAKRDEQKLKDYIAKKESDRLVVLKAQQEEDNKFKERMYNLREIEDIPVLKEDAAKFYDFMTKKDKDGKTEMDKKMTAEKLLKVQYMIFKGLDKIKNQKIQAETKATQEMKKVIKRYAPKESGGSVKAEEAKSPSNFIPSIWDIPNVRQ